MSDPVDDVMAVMASAFDPTWGEAWSRRQISDSLAFPGTHLRVIGSDGSPAAGDAPAAGFTLVRAAPGEEELLLIAVVPWCRGRGLGFALLSGVAADARERGAHRLFLEMRENNPARTLYERFGFRPIGRRKHYYRTADGRRIDAVTFACDL